MWTLPTLFAHDAPVFDRIANYFQTAEIISGEQ